MSTDSHGPLLLRPTIRVYFNKTERSGIFELASHVRRANDCVL